MHWYKKLGIPHHEFWPWWAMTLPIVPAWIYSAIKLRRATYFTTANPCIEDGGFIDESKIELNELIPLQCKPYSLYFRNPIDASRVVEQVQASSLTLPIIAKPDKGGRGKKVSIINSLQELTNYAQTVREDFLVQELITYPLEVSIFYYRIPNTSEYDIISIVAKEYLTVVGDGVRTVGQLLMESARGAKQIERLQTTQVVMMNSIPQLNEIFIVEPIGNHIRGTIFRNHAEKITDQLKKSFHEIMLKIPGFYFGRIDLKTASWNDLEQGNAIKILELNGVGSDLAHIYDPDMSYRTAIADQWRCAKILERVTAASIAEGNKPTSFKEMWRKLKRVLEDLNS